MRRPMLVLALIGALLASGCWSRREINDLGAVISLGIDQTDEGKLDVVLAIAQPGATPSGKGQQGTLRRSRVILRREGATIAEAVHRAELASPRRIALDHSQVVVLGERFAQSGVDALMDYLIRSPQVRLSTRIMVLQGSTPVELMEAEPLMRTTQAEALRELESARRGLSVSLKEFFIARASTHISPIVSTLRLVPHRSEETKGAHEVEVAGAAVFKEDRVALYLSPAELRASLWLTSDARGLNVSTSCPDNPKKFLTIRITRASHDIEPLWDGRRLSFSVRLNAHATVVDMPCHLSVTTPTLLLDVEKSLRRELTSEILQLLRRLQTHELDPFGFGEQVRAKLPAIWPRVGEERWFGTWAATPVNVIVQLDVVHLNMTVEPPSHNRSAK